MTELLGSTQPFTCKWTIKSHLLLLKSYWMLEILTVEQEFTLNLSFWRMSIHG